LIAIDCSYNSCTKLARKTTVRERGHIGRPAKYARLEYIAEYVTRKSVDPTWSMGPEDLIEFGLPADAPETTKRVYLAHALRVPGIKEQTSTSTQTACRYTSTHSDRPVVSYALWLAHGLFLIGHRYDKSGAVRVRNKLSELVSKANGGAPVFAMPLTNMFNSDASTVYVYSAGVGPDSTAHWARIGPANRDTRGLSSIKDSAGSNRLNLDGTRISISCLGNAAGSFAPLVITSSGWSSTQMRVPMKRFLLPGGDYLVLLRAKGDDPRTAAVEHWKAIDREVHVPWIAAQMTAAGYGPGHPLHVAFQTFDGCGPELEAFTDPAVLEECEKNGIRRGKGHRSRTEREQIFDLLVAFKEAKAAEAKRKVETDNERRAAASFSQTVRNDPDIQLGAKLQPVADFVATLPRWKQLHLKGPDLTRAAVDAGWIQSLDKPYPDLHGPLKTSLLPASPAVLTALSTPASFSKLYWGMAQNATMIESHCDDLGIPLDIKPDGSPYVRDETKLPLQNRRHALLSNGVILAGLREAVESATTDASAATATEITAVDRKLQENAECENQILALSGTTLSASGLVHFGTKGNTSLLKAFLHVRKRLTSASKGLVFPNRGKLPVDLRAAAAEEAVAVAKILRGNDDCVAQVLAKSGKSLALSGVGAFSSAGNTKLLRAFYHARKRPGSAPDGLTIPKRGKLPEAQATPPIRNLLRLCWEARNDPLLLLPPAPFVAPPQPVVVAAATPPEPNLLELCWSVRDDPVIMVAPPPFVPPMLPAAARLPTPAATVVSVQVEYNAPSPAEVLGGDQGKDWMRLAQREMHCVVLRPLDQVSIERAVRSHEVALARLPAHVQQRVKAVAKQDLDFFAWKWVLLNLGRGCAVLECTTALYGDHEALSWSGCYVASAPGTMLSVNECARNLIGAYAARHTPTGKLVRIGMAAAQGPSPMYSRWHEGHAAAARLAHSANVKNRFYKSYCSKLATEPTQPPVRIGWFEDLEPMVFFGMKPGTASAFVGRGGDDLLVWPEWFLAELDRTMSHLPNIESKQVRCVCYLFELIGDLLIAPADNVSEAPGVEQLIRQYGSGD